MLSITQAIDIINNRRNQAELQAFKKLNYLRQDRFFDETEQRVRELSFEIARKESQNIDTSELKEQLAHNEQLLENRLKELSYCKDDLLPQYSCPICKDTGFVQGERCTCLKNLIFNSIKNSSSKLETDIDSFDKVKYDIYDDLFKNGYKNTFKQLKRFAQDFPNVKPFLLFIGQTGSGKSFMASVVSNVLLKKGFSVLYLNACELNDIFLKYHLADIEKKNDIFSPLVECDLLVIDDLGSENIYKNVTVTYLYNLIIKRNKKSIIITTNLPYEEIDSRYERRISSRLFDINYSLRREIPGYDLRKSK